MGRGQDPQAAIMVLAKVRANSCLGSHSSETQATSGSVVNAKPRRRDPPGSVFSACHTNKLWVGVPGGATLGL